MMNRALWMLRMGVVAIAALTFTGSALAQSQRVPGADPVMTEELMARLIRRASASAKEAWIEADICATFALCDGTNQMPAKKIVLIQPDGGRHAFITLLNAKDIIVSFEDGDVLYVYLTDKTGNLRAALIGEAKGDRLRLITNEQASEKFKAEMRLMAKGAEKLPPATADLTNK